MVRENAGGLYDKMPPPGLPVRSSDDQTSDQGPLTLITHSTNTYSTNTYSTRKRRQVTGLLSRFCTCAATTGAKV